MAWSSLRTDCFLRVGLLGSAILTGGKFLPRLNISRKPIAHKYREGNVKSTLKRELKVFETVMVKQWDLLVHMVCYAGSSVHGDSFELWPFPGLSGCSFVERMSRV